MYKIKFNRFSKDDYDNLDGGQKKLVEKSFRKLEIQGMGVGEWLHGNLSSCKKLKHQKAGLRVVFRESSEGIEIIDIITIGKRSDKDVYKTAYKRLKDF